jgi:protein-disulfide isomerase
MRLRHGWLIVLVVAVLLVAACGGPLTGPTTAPEATQASEATQVPEAADESGEQDVAAASEEEPTEATAAPAELPVDSDDWHILGSPDAPVTIVEYSDFQ